MADTDDGTLRRDLAALREENAALRRQNHDLHVLLDLAMARLEGLGHAVIPKVSAAASIRQVRAERMRRDEGHGSLRAPSPALAHVPKQRRKFGASSRCIRDHRGAVLAASFSPSGDFLATASFDRTCGIYSDAAVRLAPLKVHDGAVVDVAWSPDGRVLTAGVDGRVVLRDPELSLQAVLEFETPNLAAASHCTALDTALLCCCDASGFVAVVDVRQGPRAVWSLPSGTATSLCSDITGRVVTGDARGVVTVWDLRYHRGSGDAAMVPRGHLLAGSGACVSHLSCTGADDARTLLAVSEDSCVRIYHPSAFSAGEAAEYRLATTLSGLHTRAHPARAAYRAATPQQRRGAFSYLDDEDRAQQAPQRALGEASLVASGGTDGRVHVFEGPLAGAGDGGSVQYTPLQSLDGHSDVVYGVAFHPRHPVLASFSADATVRIWK